MLTKSWLDTIDHQQDEIKTLFNDVPSLMQYAPKLYEEAYPKAVKEASKETKIPINKFPLQNPWTIQQAISFDPPSAP